MLGAQVLGEWGSDKGLYPLGSKDKGSFVKIKLNPFLGGDTLFTLHWSAGIIFIIFKLSFAIDSLIM